MNMLKGFGIALVASLLISTGVHATPLSFWATDGWTQFANDDGHVGPGSGGQAYDAEYLYYKLDGNTLSLGLQSGFNLITGNQYYSPYHEYYYAGDLALSFDGNTANGYEYGVDFGLITRGYSGRDYSPTSSNTTGFVEMDGGTPNGADSAGLYAVTTWSNDIYYHASDPFAMDVGSLASSLLSNHSGIGSSGSGNTSYYRTVSFDLSGLGLGNDVDAHWTMSCGNDAIDGGFHYDVPEPATLSLMGLGLIGLGFMRRRKAKI